jgi:hypothetical protein
MPVSRPRESLPGAAGPKLGDLPPIDEAASPAAATEPTPVGDAVPAAPAVAPGPATRIAAGTGSFRRHEVALGDGKLVLDRDGSIRRIAVDGSVTATWQADDPEWPRYAIRFGLRPGAGAEGAIPSRPPRRVKLPRK